MKREKNLLKRLKRWYRNLFIEYPEDYGEPMSPGVERFNADLSDKKETPRGVFEEEPSKRGNQD